ncbi:MAG: HFX_2341 family transcriptional regulator domain-containing protein [Promethearchaeota archaeon]
MPKKLNENEEDLWKVHITYNVKEHKRITHPILLEKPNILYYIHHHGGNEDVNLISKEENLRLIRKMLPECQIIETMVNYVDYYDVIGNLAKIISKEKKHAKEMNKISRITINAGTGSKMVAIANIDAHRLWDVNIIYPYSLNYDPNASSTHSGAIVAAEPPKLEFRKPSIELIQAMQILYWLKQHDPYGRKREFVQQKDWQEAIYETFKIDNVTKNSDPKKYDSSQKMRIKEKYVKRLDKYWHFLYRTKQGRSYKVYFTEEGLKMAKVFMNYDYGVNFDSEK